jgi:hypothetical protein
MPAKKRNAGSSRRATASNATKGARKTASSAPQSAETTTKPSVGRPSDYKPEFAEKAFKLCLLGAKDSEIADILGVSESTLNLWKQEHVEFSESMLAGKDEADAAIAHSLYHRAKGYSHAAVKIMQDKGAVIVEPYTEHYPPDTAAASLWLRNRQPARWRDKIDHELAGKDGGPIKTEGTVTLKPDEAYLRMLGK